ncbi:C-type lectin domain family 9 member A-like [Dicentrarchus labrax]|uniref:C-type lectin domain-containing protein n=1 Tax=Dicentrarchus labrax TaxID=13489 RepID=A0A8P4K1D0_DICLA|nr:C-type lectin domain family 9 member A-like [Dicentrarchus labrax]
MEPEEQIYVNLEELGDYRTEYHRPEETETKPVRTDAVAGEETETWPPFKVTTVCLGLLCLLLLTTVIGLGAVYDRDFKQLSRDLANHTAEKDQLLVRYQNLTDERDQLQTIHELNNKLGTCPHGWRQFGCSCYYLYTRKSTWANSRQTCLSQGADLVIIDSQEEMVFLNKLGARLKFWIGLSQSSTHRYLSTWAWANGRSFVTSYWQNDRLSYDYYGGGQCCAAFNSFNSNWRIKSWSSEVCSQVLQWVCEKQAQMSFLS